MSDDETQKVEQIMKSASAQLMEMGCDAVRMFCSWRDAGHTDVRTYGAGNWYAQAGMAREFLERETGRVSANELAKTINPER